MAVELSATTPAQMSNRPRPLELRAVSKRFGLQIALSDVDLDLRAGEVHALLGQNGSGKSTLIKILAGFHRPDGPARAAMFGRPLDLGSASAAHEAGLRFVHQDLALIRDLDVVDNLALGEGYGGRLWLRDSRERDRAEAILADLGIAIEPTRRVADLSPAERTMVAVARALHSRPQDGSILVLDETTATLTEDEVELVFGLLGQVRDRGGTVLYVTHRLEEVFAIADRVTVVRDGRCVGTSDVAALDRDRLVELIVGRPVEALYPDPPPARAEVVLRARRLGGEIVSDVDLDLHRGEILGIAGVTGSGCEEVPYLLFGATQWRHGRMEVRDRTFGRMNPTTAIRVGLALIPADRVGQAATPALSVRENVTLPLPEAGRSRWIRTRSERADVRAWLERVGVEPPDPEAPFSVLSGGTQQKVILARWFRTRASVLLLHEPTQGIDVGSRAAVYEHLADRAREGVSILLVSSDYEELAALCDRALVMVGGRIAATLAGATLTADALSRRALEPASVQAGSQA